MAEVNEEIVRRYFELDGYFVRSNIAYRFKTEKGAGWSDIDLCAFHPITGDAAAIEVKGWHTERITPASLRDWPALFFFTRSDATDRVRELLGNRDFRRILVVGRLGDRGRQEVLGYARDRGVEIMEFPTILSRLIKDTQLGRSADSEAEHMIRVLNAYGFLNKANIGESVGPG
jgi:hypothetical protein